MATKSKAPGVRAAVRKAAAPFWKSVEASGLDRFFVERLLRALLRRFRADRFARVRQGGIYGDGRAELGRVFVDLDATPGVRRAPRGSGGSERIVASWTDPAHETREAPGQHAFFRGRMSTAQLEVVLGGPGQGKSTVGRFLVLIQTSMLLVSAPIEGIVPAAELTQMEGLLSGLAAEEIPLPATARLPVWIELRELADGLLQDEESERYPLGATLRWYAANELREIGDAGTLETALGALPWCMVLDGLDEVPPERGRRLVAGSVAGLRSRFSAADGWLIATSRPQSYDPEIFGPGLVERTLLPMKPERAELYGHRFITSLYPEDDAERATLLRNLADALADPKSAALMSNPLLVTIMAIILMHHGRPSSQRWTLFEEYYETLYRRETERGTYASGILREHKPLLTAIHRHVGMSLQARSEKANGVSALLPEHELRAIIREHLVAGHDEEEAAGLTDQILRAVEQRLVLLVQAQEGMYGFELRSFQEFMAAWQIVSLPEAQGGELLRRLAPLAAWRNVVLLAIGQPYAKGLPLAWERSVGLCAALDEAGDPAAKIALPGARLALDVLSEGPYGKAKKPRDELVSRALELLRVPPSAVHHELAEQVWEIHSERLLGALRSAMEEPRTREAAWVTLLTLPDDERAKTLMDQYWPASQEDRRAIVRGSARLLTWRFRFERWERRWLSAAVAQDLTLSLPGELGALLTGDDRRGRPVDHGPIVYPSFEAREYVSFSWGCGRLAPLAGKSPRASLSIPLTNEWALVRAGFLARKAPSAARLASILDDLAAQWDGRATWHWPRNAPWPLVSCILSAQTGADLVSIAGRLRRGELGDAPRWEEIEAKEWKADIMDLVALAAAADPLRAILVDGLIAPYDETKGMSVTEWLSDRLLREELRELDRARRSSPHQWVRSMIAQFMLVLLDISAIDEESSTGGDWPSAEELVDVVNAAGTVLSVAWLATLPSPVDPRALDTVVTATRSRIVATRFLRPPLPLHSLVGRLFEAVSIAPASPRLQRALVVLLQDEASKGRLTEVAVEPGGDGLDAWLLRFVSGVARSQDVPALARLLAATGDEWEVRACLQVLAAHPRSSDLVLPVVETLLELPDASSPVRSASVEFIAGEITTAPSLLASPEAWKMAGLPSPPPMFTPPEPPELPGAHIASIEIANLRAFPQLFRVDAPATKETGQWMVFLGENATGKTTLLRAVAMALASAPDAAAVPSNLEGPLRRDASRDGLVRVRLEDGRELATTVTGPAGEEQIVIAADPRPRPWVVGYGCRRGSAIGGTDMDNAFVPFRDLDNLFDRPRGVIRASGWLKELQRLAKNNGSRSRLVFEAAREALRKVLLGAENVRVENEVLVDFHDRKQVPLTLLSDGYLTTAGWIVDLMARWLKRNEGRKSVDEGFCATMEGVVLLDEIDLHLHPRWQERVIEDVRGLFPKMTFLATTHHPLTLRGARKGEVFVLDDHDRSGAITALQHDIPPGTRVDELLTGQWFNRPSAIVDAETRDMLDRHQLLILSGAKAGDPERKALEKELRARLGRYADTSLERLAATIVARHLDGTMPEPSARKREEVRASVAELLQRRDAKRS